MGYNSKVIIALALIGTLLFGKCNMIWPQKVYLKLLIYGFHELKSGFKAERYFSRSKMSIYK